MVKINPSEFWRSLCKKLMGDIVDKPPGNCHMFIFTDVICHIHSIFLNEIPDQGNFWLNDFMESIPSVYVS